jgi:hypothetical protein
MLIRPKSFFGVLIGRYVLMMVYCVVCRCARIISNM